MKLSVNILYSALKNVYPQIEWKKGGRKTNELSLSCPYYYPDSFKFHQDRIYVVSTAQLPGVPAPRGHCLLITTQTPEKQFWYKSMSILVVPGVELPALYNAVLAVFETYETWDRALQDLVFQNAPVEDYLRRSLDVIGNPMSIHDNNFTYLARAGAAPTDGARLGKQSTSIDPDFLYRADAETGQSIFYSRQLVRFQDDATGRTYFFFNLFTGNTVAGRLVVADGQRPFLPQDDTLVEHLGKYLEAALSYSVFSGQGVNLRKEALLELLGGKKDHSADRIRHLKAVSPLSKLTEDQRLYCLAAACLNSDTTEQYIAYQLERAIPGSVVVLFQSKIVILCANQPKQTSESFFWAVRALLEQYSSVAGCSSPFTDFDDLRYCLRQAEFTLQIVGGKYDGRRLYHFKDYAIEYFIQHGCSDLPARLICADCVQKLAMHDKTAAVSYCDSLQIYLNSGMNCAEAARRLNVKRNTFLARLERIQRYIDLDLEDENNRLYLLISLRLIRL